jgi:predicted membrane protein
MIPIILLGVVVLMSRYLTDQIRNTLCFVASLMLLVQVFAMRWNVVIGGQIFSKSLRGFREAQAPGLFEKEGVALAILIFVFPLVFIALFNRVLPVFEPADAGDTNEAEGQPA